MKVPSITKKSDESHARIGVLEAELARVLSILIEQYQPIRVYLYGSLATGLVSEWSDLDLIIIKTTNKRFLDRSAEVLSLLNPRVGMDIAVYTPDEWSEMVASRPFIQEEVIKKGVCLHEAA